jgi:hypothetical protein
MSPTPRLFVDVTRKIAMGGLLFTALVALIFQPAWSDPAEQAVVIVDVVLFMGVWIFSQLALRFLDTQSAEQRPVDHGRSVEPVGRPH